jgi:hypothetical protein
MKKPRGRHLATWAITTCLSLLAIGTFIVPAVLADPAPSPTPEPWTPFSLHPSQPGAIPWERHTDEPPVPVPPGTTSMTAAEYEAHSREPKASPLAIKAWVEATHGEAVHQAFSAYASEMAERVDVQEAAHSACLAGIENVGVEP